MAVNQQKFLPRRTTVQSAAVAPQQQLVAAPADTAALQDISKSLTRIIQLLTQQNTQVTKEANQEKKNQEVARRKKVEFGLEGAFAAVKNTAQAVVAPVKSILDQIIQFFVTLFLGKALLNLINWFANSENQSKVRSIARFLKDWWPSLIAGYLLFGTGFGRVVRSLAKVAIAGTARLVVIAARLAKAIATGKGLKGIGQALGSGGGGGKFGLVKLGLGALATVGTGMAINKFMSGGEETPQLDVPEAPAVPSMGAFGGGFADLKTIFAANGGAISSQVSPFTTFFGSGGLASLMAGVNGVVSGPKGIDRVPAMLTDGEFVMSRGAVQKFGVGALEAMNAAGGGTNRPRVVNQRVYAAGGGLIGNAPNEGTDALYSGGLMADRKKQLGQQSIDDRLKRIEQQIKIQRALASGGGIQTAAGMGFGTTYQGRKSILVKGGTQKLGAGTGYDAITVPKINVGGMEYFAQKKGNDIIYTSNFASGLSGQVDKYGARSRGYSGVGSGLVGGSGLKNVDKKDLPKSKIMMGPDGPFVAYLAFKGGEPTYERPKQRNKGMLESLTDFFDPKGARGRQETLNARTMRMTAISDLEDMRSRGMTEDNIKKMLNERLGPNGYSRATNDLKAKQNKATIFNRETTQSKPGESITAAKYAAEQKEGSRRGGAFGQLWRTGVRMFGTNKDIERVDAADKASESRIKQRVAASQGRYYSSSDGKYYKDYAAAESARKARLAKLGTNKPSQKPITPTPKPQPKVVTQQQVAGGGQGGRRGSGASPSVPQFPASKSNKKTSKFLGIF
jgi:hypothetical protein